MLVYLVEECGASLRHLSNHGFTIMHQAAIYGHLDIVRYAAKKAPELTDMPGSDNVTPIMYASMQGMTPVVRHLARLGCSLSRKDKNGFTALGTARHFNHHDTARLLSDINSAGGWPQYMAGVLKTTGHKSLLHAAHYGDMAAVRALVETGADADEVEGEHDRTPVFGAAAGGHLAVLVYLVEECGASLRHVDNGGATIMHFAAYNGHLDIVRYVAKQAPELIDMPANDNCTPIMEASFTGKTTTVRHLARLGCSLSLRDDNGFTALDYARKYGQHETARLLSDIASAGSWRPYAIAYRMSYVRIRHEVHKIGTVLPEDHDDRELLHFLFGKSERGASSSSLRVLPRWLFRKVVGFLEG